MTEKQDTFVRVRDRYGRLPAVALLAMPVLVLLVMLFLLNYQVARPGGDWEISDFTMMWLGGKGLLDGADMYDPVEWKQLHQLYAPNYTDNPVFLYLMPAAFFFAPFALFPVGIGASLWLLMSEIMLMVVVAYFLRSMSIRSPLALVGLFLMIAFFPPVPIIIFGGQYSVIMLFFLWAMYVLLKAERDVLAGICLSLLIMRPNPFVLLVPIVLLWVVWKRRWSFVLGSTLSALLLLVVTWMMRPGWPLVWLDYVSGGGGKLSLYSPVTPTLWGLVSDLGAGSSADVQTTISATLCAVLIVLVFFIMKRQGYLTWGAVLSVGTALSLFTTPYAWNYDQVLLLFPVLYALVLAEGLPANQKRRVWMAVVAVLLILPYSARYIAFLRNVDTFSSLVSLGVLIFVLAIMSMKSAQKPSRMHS